MADAGKQPQPNRADGWAEGPEGDQPMSFFDHLAELRSRLIKSALSLLVAFGICYAFKNDLFAFITQPLEIAWGKVGLPGQAELQNLGTLDDFLVDVRLALYAALFVAAPALFYQVWMFVAPGLYKQEKRLVIPFTATSAIMFIGGAAFCYTFVLPIATEFFLSYSADKSALHTGVNIVPRYTYHDYTAYTLKLLLAFGLMFEFPLAIFFLAKAGMLTHRTLLRYWRPAVLLIMFASAILTPPDPITLLLMGLPMTALYFASVGVAFFVSKPELERIAQLEAELAEEAAREDADNGTGSDGTQSPGEVSNPRD